VFKGEFFLFCAERFEPCLTYAMTRDEFELSTDYNQILNNLTQSFGREAAISLR
jgi:hypothetical protein